MVTRNTVNFPLELKYPQKANLCEVGSVFSSVGEISASVEHAEGRNGTVSRTKTSQQPTDKRKGAYTAYCVH